MIKMFLTQVDAIKKLVEDNTTKNVAEKEYDLDFNSLFIPLMHCKVIELSKSKGIDTRLGYSAEDELFLQNLVKTTTEKNAIFNKIYKSITVKEEPESEIGFSFSSNMPGLLYYFKNKIEGRLEENNNVLERRTLALRSSIIYLCICLETLTFEMLKSYYLNKPNNKHLEDKTMKLSDLRTFSSIEDARIFLIEEDLESLFRNDFATWFKKVDSIFNIEKEFGDIEEIISSVSELFLRRNLYVHANGIVNDIYIKKTNTTANKGEVLTLEKEYIDKQIQNVCRLGWYMFYKYSCYISEGYSEEFFSEMNNLLLDYLETNCDAIPIIFNKLENEKKASVQESLFAKINKFLFFKVNDRLSEATEELNAFDTSAYAPEFAMAKAIILDSDDAYSKTEAFLNSLDETEFFTCLSWPLISLVRNKEPFRPMIESIMNNYLFADDSHESSELHSEPINIKVID